MGFQLTDSGKASVMAWVQLDLFEDVVALPWNGKSPRALTRAAKALFFKRERQKDERFFVDVDQFDLIRAAKKRPRRISAGAPSLLPLPRR